MAIILLYPTGMQVSRDGIIVKVFFHIYCCKFCIYVTLTFSAMRTAHGISKSSAWPPHNFWLSVLQWAVNSK